MRMPHVITSSNGNAARRNGSANSDHLDLVERSIASPKAELAAGTPIEYRQIVELEEQLKDLRVRLKLMLV